MRAGTLWIVGVLVGQLWFWPAVGSAASEGRQQLPEKEVRTAVERLLAEKVEGRGWEVTIRQLVIPGGVTIPKGVRDLELIAPAAWDGWGPVSLALVVRVNGAVEKNLSLRLAVEARTEMVVAGRQLQPGTVLTRDDLQLQVRDVAQAAGLHLKNIDDALGKRLKTVVRSGAPLRGNQLEKVPVVRTGQLVTIVAENAGMRITVTGRAKSAGGVGDLIRVENISSHKEFPARVLDSSTVEAGF